MRAYGVFDNSRAAVNGDVYCIHVFIELAHAVRYAREYLGGSYRGNLPEIVEPNVKYDYNGYGDVIEVRELQLT